MKTFSLENGLYTGGLPSLSSLLEQWQSLVEKTTKEWIIKFKDAPWCYNERASLSLLAGAIWQLKGSVFEEYTTYRRIQTKRGVSYKHGMLDMEFRLGNQYYLVEAKQCYPTLGMRKENAVPIINSNFDQAKSQVAQVKARGYHPLAIAFVVPKVPVNYKIEMHDNLSGLIEEIIGFRKTTAAWIFPKQARGFRLPTDSPYHDYFFPGIILVATSCKA